MAGERVVVIGGGIIGCLTAWRLRQRGARVTVLDKGALGKEASWAGAGILCPIHPWLYPDAFTRLVDRSLRLFAEMQRELHVETGMDVQWRRCGLLIPEFPWDAHHHRDAALAWSARFGWEVVSLDASALRAHEPALAEDAIGGLLWPKVAQVRNPRLLKAVRQALRRAGVAMVEHAVVESLLMDGGRLSGVRTEDGRVFAADMVLLAAGSWSGELAARMGFRLPVEPVKGQIVLLKGPSGALRHIVKHDQAYFVPRSDGRILVGASMERVGFTPGTTEAVKQKLLDAMRRIAPGLAAHHIERAWMGFRPGSPDGLPYLGPVPALPGLWVASGHYRNGVALAPVTADVMSRWMLGENPGLDMTPFAVGRPLSAHAQLGLPPRDGSSAQDASAFTL
ncbi:MAG: glycine oxidase ThiO [Zetaproteobacteria bacterium]|nr:MAG: glycine oxidase ThiO [Zetaproteobacteria bacterium]